jgi:hypothetical protein
MDPHGDRAYSAGVLAAHVAAVDPHPQYLTQAEGDVRYIQDFFLDGGQPGEIFLPTQTFDGGAP